MKFQSRLVSGGSRALAILGSIIKVIEFDAEELDVDKVTLSFNNPSHNTIDLLLLNSSDVEVLVSGAPWLEERELELEGLGVLIHIRPSSAPSHGLRLRTVYEILPRIVINLDSGILRKLSRTTTRSGVEFIALYREDGSLVLLEGDRYKVSIPTIEVLAAVHTHPEGSCGFSRADVRSAVYALTDLALFEAVVTPTCAFYIARIGFLDESDFERLLNIEGDIATPMELATVRFEKLWLDNFNGYRMVPY